MSIENSPCMEMFEKWATGRFDGTFDGEGRPLMFDLTKCCGKSGCGRDGCQKTDYKIPVTENAWVVWQAAFEHALMGPAAKRPFEK
jgi:hypothetical protein